MLFYDSTYFLTKFRQKLTLDLGSPHPEEDPALSYYRNQILNNFDKKYIESGSSVDPEAVAIATFKEVNCRMERLNKAYTSDLTKWETIPELRVARHFVRHVLGPVPLLEEVFRKSKNSSGTSIGVKFSDTSIEAKMTFPISGSKACCRLWERYKHWDWNFYSQACHASFKDGIRPETIPVSGSRSTTVPKSSKTDRLIAVEPTLNMFFQQGVLSLMNERLVKSGLSPKRDAEKHRRLAFDASITGHLATIDFSSMSDSLSLAICHYLLPKEWYTLLFTLRSHRSLIKGEMVELHMMSTMGNATTFPLETLLLYAIAVAVQSYDPKRDNEFAYDTSHINIYGDDCILPTVSAGRFLEVCDRVGFKINTDKSFTDGPFRESCGGDFYRGRDVRPFFLSSLPAQDKKKTNREAHLYTILNGVIRMYIKYFGTTSYVYDKHLLRFLFDCLSKETNFVKFVPEDFPEDAGVCHIRDIHRLLAAYQINPSKIGLSKFGQWHFSYLKYHLPNRGVIHEGLRYRSSQKSWERRAEESLEEAPFIRPIRKCGFYVKKTSISLVVTPCTSWDSRKSEFLGRVSCKYFAVD